MINETSNFGGFITNFGTTKQARLAAIGKTWLITHMLIGDAHNGADPVPDPEQSGLINMRHRAQLNQLYVAPENPNVLIAELALPPEVGGWWIRELGLEDEDGDFIAVANCAPSYKPLLAQGAGRTQVVRIHIIAANTGNIALKIDPALVLATRDYLERYAAKLRHQHDAGDINSGELESERIPKLALTKVIGLNSALKSKADKTLVAESISNLQKAVEIGLATKAIARAVDKQFADLTKQIATQLSTKVNGAMTMRWVGSPFQPSWLLGGNDPQSITVYNPAYFSVQHADTAREATIATSLGGQALAEGVIGAYCLNKNHTWSERGGAWALRGWTYDWGTGQDGNIGTRTCLWQRIG